MFAQFYQNGVLKNPKTVFIILIIAIISFGYFSKDFRLDASSETLLIEGDPDLAYLKEVTERYGSKDFLILTYTPNEAVEPNTATIPPSPLGTEFCIASPLILKIFKVSEKLKYPAQDRAEYSPKE